WGCVHTHPFFWPVRSVLIASRLAPRPSGPDSHGTTFTSTSPAPKGASMPHCGNAQSSNGAGLRGFLDFFQFSLPDPAGVQYNVDLCQIASSAEGYSRLAG